MSRHVAKRASLDSRVSVPGPWRFTASATRQALLAFEARVHDWQSMRMQVDVLDDIVKNYQRIIADTLQKDAAAARARGQR